MLKKFAYYSNKDGFEIGFSNKNFDFDSFFKGKKYAILKQIHSDIIIKAHEPFSGLEGDGLITDREELYLIVKTADCYPVLFFNKKAGFIGAVHSGWRGTYKNILKSFKEKAIEYASENTLRKYTRIIIGPGICGKCYEVKDDVVKLFKEAGFKNDIFYQADNKIFLDVRKAIHFRLEQAGFAKENIRDINLCTYESSELVSYRRDKTKKRLYNFIKKNNNI